jgi:hypothetical protein
MKTALEKVGTYKTWLPSKTGNPSIGEGTTLLRTFLSYNQRQPFIPPL